MFEVSENDWRDRFLFSTSWAGIKNLKLEYPGNPGKSFFIKSGSMFPEVEGVAKPDTSKLMNYLELFQTFVVDQYLDSGRVAKYDSVSLTRPSAILTIDAVSMNKPFILEFFEKLSGDPLIVGKLDENQIVLFSYERIKEIFKPKSYFSKP